MLAPETAERLAALIRMDRAMEAAAPLTEAVHRDTVYLTVVDRDRMAVSLIYSIYHGFGSGHRERPVRHSLPEPRRGFHA
jgi:gamma-glutamyltranspeptidase / glutathione hydrolase